MRSFEIWKAEQAQGGAPGGHALQAGYDVPAFATWVMDGLRTLERCQAPEGRLWCAQGGGERHGRSALGLLFAFGQLLA